MSELAGNTYTIRVFIDPNWVTVGAETSSDRSLSNNLIDVSGKSDAGQAADIYGSQAEKITLDAVYAPSNAGVALLETAAENQEDVQLRYYRDTTFARVCTCKIESFAVTAKKNEGATCAIGLKRQGAWGAVSL